MGSYQVQFPDYLVGYEGETEAKGYLAGVRVVADSGVYEVAVYDAIRLQQEVADEIQNDGYFAISNLLVVDRVTREVIEQAIENIASGGVEGYWHSV